MSTLAIDLSNPEVFARDRHDRELAQVVEAAAAEANRLMARRDWLARKATRQRLRSNARHRTIQEATRCELLARLLGEAVAGKQASPLAKTGDQQTDRTIILLNQLQALNR